MTIPTAIAHDYLTQRGGAERVVLALGEIWPLAPIYTSLYDPHGTFPEFARDEIHTAFVNRIRPLRSRHRLALPVLAPSFSSMRIDAEVTVCSSSGWAHGVNCTGAKVVYCHAPARWLHQVDAYTSESSFAVRAALAGLRRPLLSWDRRSAGSADLYVVNSTRTRDMVREAYGFDPEVIHPPHSVDKTGPREAVEHLEPGFFLCVSRLLPYKHLEALLHGFAQLPAERLVIVGSGPDRDRLLSLAPSNVTFLSDIPDSKLRWLYGSAEALFAVGLEDFGLTPIEAASFGLPTLARPFGGYLDTVIDGINGYFLAGLAPGDIAAAIRRLRTEPCDAEAVRRTSERFSPQEFAVRMKKVVEWARMGGLP
jgi:glycosyltransferase involved in cell wall biosynthesis